MQEARPPFLVSNPSLVTTLWIVAVDSLNCFNEWMSGSWRELISNKRKVSPRHIWKPNLVFNQPKHLYWAKKNISPLNDILWFFGVSWNVGIDPCENFCIKNPILFSTSVIFHCYFSCTLHTLRHINKGKKQGILSDISKCTMGNDWFRMSE